MNKDIRQHIIMNAIEKFDKKIECAKEIFDREGNILASQYYPQKDQKIIDSLPMGWLRSESSVDFDLPKTDQIHRFSLVRMGYCGYSNVNRWVTLKKHMRFIECNRPRNLKPSKKLKKFYYEWYELIKTKNQVAHDIYVRIKLFTTVESLIESWPKAKEYMSDYPTQEKNVALAVRFEDIDKKLKI